MKTFTTWTKEGAALEQEMEDSHLNQWQQTISEYLPEDFKDYTVLDFGCSQGAFLKHLYKKYPFKNAVGIDLSLEAIKTANQRKENLPVSYYTTEEFANKTPQNFDVVVSNSVLFFIEDLDAHAKQIFNYLNENGVYYFTFTDFSKLSNLNRFIEKIDQWANTPLVLHTLDDIVKVFNKNGFEVQLKQFEANNFITFNSKDDLYANAYERLTMLKHKYLFRLTKTNF